MKKTYTMSNRVCFVISGLFLFTVLAAASPEAAQLQENGDGTGYSSEKIDEKNDATLGEGSFYIGFRWIEGDDFSRLAEYEDDESSVALGIELETFPLPHRYFIHGEYLAQDDYYGDIGYAYRDIILVRDMVIGLHHNLDHYSYLLSGEPGLRYDERSDGEANHVDFMKNDLFLRLKAPDYPLHTFMKHRYVEREGLIQERFLLGYFGNLNKISQSRNIDWKSDDLALGVNSHLGPVEVEYAHNRFEFDPGAGSMLYDFDPSGRPPDTYPHHVIPETESYGNSLKLHTSYTGQIVAAATLSNEESTNNYSGAESDAWKGAFDLQWIPDPVVSMFFKYRHLEQNKENPERTTLSGSRSRVSYEVRSPVSTEKDLFSLSARYRPLERLTVNGNYEFEMRKRTEVDEWAVLPEDTDIHRISLTARARFMSTLKLKAEYTYQYSDNPAYNIEPDHSSRIRLNATYTPVSWITTLLDYKVSISRRDDLLYLNGNSLVEGGERDGKTDNALGSVSFTLSPGTYLTASWAYSRWKIEQDTAYSMWNAAGTGVTALPYYDRDAPYTDDAHILALSLHTKLRKDLKLKAGLSHTIAESEYLPSPSYLTTFTSKETTETVVTLELAKKLLDDWEVGLQCKAGFFDDEYSSQILDHQDGEFYVTLLTLKRYF